MKGFALFDLLFSSLIILSMVLISQSVLNASFTSAIDEERFNEKLIRSFLLSNQLVRQELSYTENERSFANVLDSSKIGNLRLEDFVPSGFSYVSLSFSNHSEKNREAGAEDKTLSLLCHFRITTDRNKEVELIEICVQ